MSVTTHLTTRLVALLEEHRILQRKTSERGLLLKKGSNAQDPSRSKATTYPVTMLVTGATGSTNEIASVRVQLRLRNARDLSVEHFSQRRSG